MPLTIYPALDVLHGRCVRSMSGSSAPPEVLDDDPLAVAARWRGAGARWLHLVDLEGALHGGPKELDLLARLIAETELSVQFGGGLRTVEDVAAALERGAARVIVSAEVAARGEMLAGCLARWGEQIAVSVDTRDGQLTVAGWLPSVAETALDFARRMVDAGTRTLILANTRGDGAADAQQFDTLALARETLPETTLIAAGSFATLEDLRRLAQAGMDGVVLGRALYDGALDLAEALRLAGETAPTPAEDAPTDTPDA